MSVELWLPALARFEPAHPLRRLLARADRLADGPRGYLAGLAAWFDAPQPLPAAALTRELAAADAGDASWLCADPAWVEPDLSGARLLACGQMQLSQAEAEALAEPLTPLLAEQGMALLLTTPERWHVRLPPGTAVPAFPAPEQALGENLLQHLPQGPEGRRWRILQNELQVALHQHPLNAQRRAAGKPPVNSLWLWGAGVLPARIRTDLPGVTSDDPLLRALAARAGIAHRARPQGASMEWPGDLPLGGLLDLQDLPANVIADAWWPAIATVAGRHPLRLIFASGERWEHRPWHRWRIWRGPRA
ncbi:phosphoglycerate mutase [Frateuria sp. STR12]|uniref:phosphoglycerate mutase n=1 Tax=Frateuria hangzhouensis TaxID=2995589 RepID=UPI002260EBE0|nr:phosphoglycerate mutase [Frateuria sp. STR12]MCX7512143.1 phosphoglycerate mutase [Frateuria sp. STR12]